MPGNHIFNPLTEGWFKRMLGAPTAVQEAAWPAIASGEHTLVSAPTGTGKTLSAFLVFIDRMKTQARQGTLESGLSLIYVSPLKSLAGDIRENLRRPLDGITEEERLAGLTPKNAPPGISVAVRTGDTTQKERRAMIKSPPNILITTPESLYILLTSKSGQEMLKTARAIIIDELHALIGSKRGAHLMLSIARLDRLCPAPLQRIGLSATIKPLSVAAEYLSPESVTIAAPVMSKKVELEVTSPLLAPHAMPQGTVWPELARAVYDCCTNARSVIAFVEGRMHAEKLAYYVNQIAGDGFAKTHHGSVSKEQRFEVEHSLRDGRLRLLVATSSMELGIDVGDIDIVVQIGNPRSISGTMQRLGRAGHNPGRTSVMRIFPRTPSEGLYCGLTAQVASDGGIEHTRPPRLCLDILAQHLVSMATGDGYDIDEVQKVLSRAAPFRDVSREDIKDVLCMLAGDYEHERDIPVRPRLLYDRIHERVEGDAYSRLLALSAGGTIPDTGQYTVRAENGAKLGELDEEFVFEARVGDKFLLGSFAWKILSLQKDDVIVTQSTPEGAQPPFWRNDGTGRTLETGLAFGAIFRNLSEAHYCDTLIHELKKLGLDKLSAQGAAGVIERQIEAAGVLPDDRTIVVERFADSAGENQLMVHSMFGRRINAPLALLVQHTAETLTGTNFGCFEDNDGFLLYPYGDRELPERILFSIDPDTARGKLEAMLTATPLFGMTFRYNAGRALMMGVRKAGRQPLWIQRLRGAEMLDSIIKYENHPLVRETKRECMEDYWDLQGLEFVLRGIRSGAIRVAEVSLDAPSPMSLPLRRQAEAVLLYEYSPTTSGVYRATLEAIDKNSMIQPSPEQLLRVSDSSRKLPEDEKQLHSRLMIEGDLVAGELDVPVSWLESLARQGRALYIEPGLWIAAEHADEYTDALENNGTAARERVVRRVLRYRGAQTADGLAERYFWDEGTAFTVLEALCRQSAAVESGGEYYHAGLYDRARRETIKSRREQIKTQPPERYAALIANRVRIAASPEGQMESALRQLCGQAFPIPLWESVILPARVNGYKPAMLDEFLTRGAFFWRVTLDGELSFHQYDDIDWDAELTIPEELNEGEKLVLETLIKRGASFLQSFSGVLESPYDTLLGLTEKGYINADSFAPVRQLMNKEKAKKTTVRQRVHSRVTAMTAGRWDILRPTAAPTVEQRLEGAFDRFVILSRETSGDIPWGAVLEVLRVWEYTGRARRGYFIEGLSGAQFIRERDFAGTVLALAQQDGELMWLSASDPAQPWGKSLKHRPDRAFINVQGSAVALLAGMPVAVFERQGRVLRVFDEAALADALRVFVNAYGQRRIFSETRRLTVKEYPQFAETALADAGFSRQMRDFELYRQI